MILYRTQNFRLLVDDANRICTIQMHCCWDMHTIQIPWMLFKDFLIADDLFKFICARCGKHYTSKEVQEEYFLTEFGFNKKPIVNERV